MEQALSLLILGALATKIIDFVKYVRNKDWNAAITQAATWVAGVVVIMLAANANAFEVLVLPGMADPLGSLNVWSLILIGLTLTSFISFAYDFKKAIDGTDSAKAPPLTKLQ